MVDTGEGREMNWDKLDLHLENLLPGVLLAAILMPFAGIDLNALIGNDALEVVVFVAISYMFGTIGNVFARLSLDWISEKTIRTYMIKGFARQKLWELSERDKINQRYDDLITIALQCRYESISGEIKKRRQTARLLRSTLLPLLLGIWVFSNMCWVWMALITVAAYLAILFLYAYAEVAIFQEAFRAAPELGKPQ